MDEKLPANKKIKILVIEDDAFIRRAYQYGLVKYGFEITEAINGEEGMKKMKSDTPDLILLDLIMPVKNGFEFLEEMRKDAKYANIPVIVLSNLGSDTDIEKAQKLGAVDYLIKAESSMAEVIGKIKSHIASIKKA